MSQPIISVPNNIRAFVLPACFVIIVAGLKAAGSILTPLALAIFIAAISLPALEWMRRKGAPTFLAILIIVLVDAAILGFIGWVVSHTILELRDELPTYMARAQELEAAVRTRLIAMGVEIQPDYYSNLLQPKWLFDMASMAARNVTAALSLFFLIILYLVFILAESVVLPKKLANVFAADGNGLKGTTKVLKEVQRYLGLKTLVSLVTGLVIWAGAEIIGVDFAIFWGLLAFVLNYIPTVGSILAAVPAILLALLQLGWGAALALSGVYLVTNIAIGSIADPILIGKTLRISPVIVLISLMFWGWVWGPIGMFLSVPLTIVVRIILENTGGGADFAALMGPPENEGPSRFWGEKQER